MTVILFFGIAECLLHFHLEELDIGKAVSTVKSVAKKIHICRCSRVPDLTLAVRNRHGTILDLRSERKPHSQQAVMVERVEMCRRNLNTTTHRKSKTSPQVEFSNQQSRG